MNFEFSVEVCIAMLKVLPVTFLMVGAAFIASMIIAVLICLVDYFSVPVLKDILNVYVSFFRATPLIPQLFLLYFGIPSFVPSLRGIPALTMATIGLSLNSAAYMRESLRGALLSVPIGQIEAGLAHGMKEMDCFRIIILPQALRVALPSIFNNLVDIVKGTSVAFTIGVIELTAVADMRASVTFNYFEAYIILMIMYWIIVSALERFSIILEKKQGKKYAR